MELRSETIVSQIILKKEMTYKGLTPTITAAATATTATTATTLQ